MTRSYRHISSVNPGSAHDAEFVRGGVQALAAVLGHRDDVFDADPEPPRQVDTGLDREAHPGLEHLRLSLDHVRRLVGGESDTVSRAVDEALAEARLGDQGAGSAVDLLTGDAGAHRLEARLLSVT